MPDKQNEFQSIVDDLATEYTDSRKRGRENKVVPLGQTRVDIEKAALEFQDMTPERRQTTMDRIGPEETMKIVRHLGQQNGNS